MEAYCVNAADNQQTASETATYPRLRWFVLLAMSLVTAGSAAIMIAPAPLMGVIAKSLNMPLSDMSAYLMGMYNLVVALSCICGGIMCDRAGLMPVLLFSSFALTVPTVALPFLGHSFPGALTIRLIQACGYGAVLASVSPVAALWFPLKERGLVTGIQAMSLSAGIATGFITSPALYQAVGSWQSGMAWLGVAGLAPAVVTLLVALAPKPVIPVSSGDDCESSHPGSGDLKVAFKQTSTWIGIVAVLCLMWVLSAFNDLAPNYLAIESPLGLGLGPLVAGKMMMTLELASMIGALLTGFVVTRIFKGNVRPVMAFGFLMFALFSASIMLPAIHENTRVVTLCLVVVGFFRSWVVPNALAFAVTHYPPHITGKIVGIWMGLGVFGTSAGVVCGAIALRTTGTYQLSMVIVVVMAFIGLIASLFLRPPPVFGLEQRAED